MTEEALEEIKNNAVNSAYDTIITILPSVMPDVDFTESELKQLLYIMMCAYEDNNSLSSAADIITAIENSYLQYVQDSAYEMYLQQEDATEETATASSLAARALASYAMESYKTQSAQEGFVYTEDTFKEEANSYVNQMIYDQVLATFNLGDDATDEEKTEAEYYAVASKVISNTAINTYELWLDEYDDTEKYPDMTNRDIKLLLRERAVDMGLPHTQQGWGLLDVERLLR